MDNARFDRIKRGMYIENGDMYQPSSPWADENGRLDIDKDISELVLDIYRHPSAFPGGSTCQGHFYLELEGNKIKIDIDKDRKVKLHEDQFSFEERHPTVNLTYTQFEYEPTQIALVTRDDEDGKNLYKRLKAWESTLVGEVFIDTNEAGCHRITLASRDVAEHSERKYNLKQALDLNAKRLNYISSLHGLIKELLRNQE